MIAGGVKTMKTAVQLFLNPANFVPSDNELLDLCHQLEPGALLRLSTPDTTIVLESDGYMELPGSGHRHPSVVRAAIHAANADEVIARLQRSHDLNSRLRHGKPTEGVISFVLGRIADSPDEYTREAVYARFDKWGRRAIPMLGQFVEHATLGIYAQHALAYLNHAYASPNEAAVPLIRPVNILNRFGRNPLARGWCVSKVGWPLRGLKPRVLDVRCSAQLPLLVAWFKQDFFDRVAGTMEQGALAMTPLSNLSFESGPQQYQPEIFDVSYGWEGVPDIVGGAHLQLGAVGGGRLFGNGDVTLALRAALALGNSVIPRIKPVHSQLSWWRLEKGFVGRRAPISLVPKLRGLLPGEAALRVFSKREWFRLAPKFSAHMAFGRNVSTTIWGVVAEGDNLAGANRLLGNVEEVLGEYGTRARAPRG